MTILALVLGLLSQCPGGSCAMPAGNYAYAAPAPQYYFVAPQPTPQLWQLADSDGQVWRHKDPAYLRAWVAHRNGLILTAPVGGR